VRLAPAGVILLCLQVLIDPSSTNLLDDDDDDVDGVTLQLGDQELATARNA
jgi:hypothetical protein